MPPKKYPTKYEQRDPRNAANRVEQRELAEIHVAGARDERGERTEERHEARDHDSQPAVALKKWSSFAIRSGVSALIFPESMMRLPKKRAIQ